MSLFIVSSETAVSPVKRKLRDLTMTVLDCTDKGEVGASTATPVDEAEAVRPALRRGESGINIAREDQLGETTPNVSRSNHCPVAACLEAAVSRETLTQVELAELEQHERHRWCERWVCLIYESDQRVSGDTLTTVIRGCVPDRKIEVFGVAYPNQHPDVGPWRYVFLAHLAPDAEGILKTKSFVLDDESVTKDTGVRYSHGANVWELLECNLQTLCKDIPAYLGSALGTDGAPGGSAYQYCFGDWQLREHLVSVLSPLVRRFYLDVR